MKIIYTELPSIVIHILIWLLRVLSIFLDLLNMIFLPIKKIKIRSHCIFAILLAAGIAVWRYFTLSDLDLLQTVNMFVIYLLLILAIKVLFRPYDKLCQQVRRKVRSHYFGRGIPRYIVMSRKEIDKRTSTNERRVCMKTWSWDSSTSVDELRLIEAEMRSELSNMDYDSEEYLKLDLQRIDVVNEISSRTADTLPKSEHGWHLPSDE